VNRFLIEAIEKSKIQDEVIAALNIIAADRNAVTPAVLIPFVGYSEPTVAPTNAERNTAILAMLSHYVLTTGATYTS